MNKYLIHVLSWLLCVWWIAMLFVWLLFDTKEIAQVWGQQIINNPQVIPNHSLISGGLLPWINSCDELFFCKHACTTPNWSWLDCMEYCGAGQQMWEACVWSNNAPWVCVGVCASTFQNWTWTSCNAQPTDPLNCPVGDACIWFSPAQTSTGWQCNIWCGLLHMTTWSTSTILTPSTPGLCTWSSSLITWSLLQYPTRWMRSCSGWDPLDPLSGVSECYMLTTWGVIPSLSWSFTLTWTLWINGANAQVHVCGVLVQANSSGVFSRTNILSGSNCAWITATKSWYMCTITTQWPNPLLSNINNVAGSCTITSSSSWWGKPSSIFSWSTYVPKRNTNSSSWPVTQRFAEKLRTSIERFETSCAYTDIDYKTIMFQDIQWNPDEEAIKTLQAYCIVKWYTISHNTKYHSEAATSIWEAIKILTKIVAMDEGVSFDEFWWHEGRLPYTDMLPNARYTPYVLYADEYGYLDGLTSWKMFWRWELKALTPISKKQFAQLLENFWKDPDTYLDVFSRSGKYVMRDEFSAVIVDAFAADLVDYSYLYWNNTLFYRWLLTRLEKTSNQKAYLTTLVNNLKTRDVDVMWWKYNLDVDWIIAFLEELLQD